MKLERHVRGPKRQVVKDLFLGDVAGKEVAGATFEERMHFPDPARFQLRAKEPVERFLLLDLLPGRGRRLQAGVEFPQTEVRCHIPGIRGRVLAILGAGCPIEIRVGAGRRAITVPVPSVAQ